ncbi:class I SAM-dependent methyltransferase [Candidatus Korarchaeum cryptofilum]|jgi:SAM-dependent methyltransferase|uniref:Methyltransferase type 11 n=1 Tax=Korarchaeum cryptofilum (strain OPF8) TaxID=374847 RepID=B1L5I3_KORCO|nr:class I SAM-dependent methyltransferase [Candidatus Korarchaeum cryptofilum]ACB07712.1 Methyltransferase type 11 [Candidatus Korarchaeum cryptofilum OPF8]
MSEIARIYDEIADSYFHFRSRPWPEVELVDSGPVLDLGCGSGRNASYLMKRGFEIICADISLGMLNMASRIFSGERVQCDAAFLPFRDGSFSTVLYIATLHHLEDDLRLRSLMEVRRVLKDGGKAIISVWALFQPRFFRKFPEMFLNFIRGGDFHDVYVPWRKGGRVFMRYYHLFTRSEFLSLLRKAGFSEIKYHKRSFRSRFFAENHVAVVRK